MKKEHLLAAMNEISDHYLLDARQPTAAKRSIPQLGKVALIAACLCALLVGGTFAAEAVFGIPVFKPVDVFPITSEPMHGFKPVIDQPEPTTANPMETMDIAGVAKIPADAFSEEIRTLAAEHGSGLIELCPGSWQDVEDLLGIDLLDNPVLDHAATGSLRCVEYSPASTKKCVCRLTLGVTDGKLSHSSAEGVYFLNYVYQNGGGSAPVRLALTVKTCTENARFAPEEMFLTYGFPEDYTFTSEHYATPNGVNALLVGVHHPDSSISYYSFFTWKGSAVTLQADFVPDPAHALSTLKEVLGAFR